ncbi:hypothetical protein TRVL_02232 [Trypanosoma vivax]|nr:hypothetical protein TRVL_02232 [Trypanosoma vivax]
MRKSFSYHGSLQRPIENLKQRIARGRRQLYLHVLGVPNFALAEHPPTSIPLVPDIMHACALWVSLQLSFSLIRYVAVHWCNLSFILVEELPLIHFPFSWST